MKIGSSHYILKERFLGVEPVFGLGVRDGLGMFQHSRSHLFTVMGRHVVHEYGPLGGLAHEM